MILYNKLCAKCDLSGFLLKPDLSSASIVRVLEYSTPHVTDIIQMVMPEVAMGL
jgi:hypothetical protein